METLSTLTLPPDSTNPLGIIGNETVDRYELISTLNITDFTNVSVVGDNGNGMEPGEKVKNIYVWLWPVQIAIFLFTLVGNMVVVYAVCVVKRFRR